MFGVCCWRILLQNLIFQIFIHTIEQLELKDARTRGECHTFVESRYQSAISLDILFVPSLLIPTPLSWFINLHQEIFDLDFCPKLDLAWPSHISWQIQLYNCSSGWSLFFSPIRHCVELSGNLKQTLTFARGSTLWWVAFGHLVLLLWVVKLNWYHL